MKFVWEVTRDVFKKLLVVIFFYNTDVLTATTSPDVIVALNMAICICVYGILSLNLPRYIWKKNPYLSPNTRYSTLVSFLTRIKGVTKKLNRQIFK